MLVLLSSFRFIVHAQYNIVAKQPRMTGWTLGALMLQCIHNYHIFYLQLLFDLLIN